MERNFKSISPWVIGLITLAIAATALVIGATALADGSSSKGKTEKLRFLLREQISPESNGPPKDFLHALYRGELLDPKTRTPLGVEVGYCAITDEANEIRSNCNIVLYSRRHHVTRLIQPDRDQPAVRPGPGCPGGQRRHWRNRPLQRGQRSARLEGGP